MKKHTSVFVAITIIAGFMLSACSGGNGQAEPSAPPTNPPSQNEATTASPEASPTTAQQPDLSADNQGNTTEPDTPTSISGEVIISFDYERISGSASNQWAVWIEDMGGNLIRTLYATAWTADVGYTTRPDSIALWIEKSDRASMTDAEVDAISGATPRAGTQSYTWDLTDANGDTVDPGEYRFVVEGTLRWKNYVLYSGTIGISDAPMTVQADADYIYEASDRYAALTSESPENAMIRAVTASFVPNK